MTDDFSYGRYFRERWDEGKTFINVEHDTAFWPGALEEIWDCPEPLCIFGHGKDEKLDEFGVIALLVLAVPELLVPQAPLVLVVVVVVRAQELQVPLALQGQPVVVVVAALVC
jgi:hypothetical protein